MCDDGSETLRLLQCDRHGLRWDRHSASRPYTSPLVPTTIHSGLSFINRFSIKLKLSCVGMRCGMICEVEFMVSSHIRRSASSYRHKRWKRAGPFFRPPVRSAGTLHRRNTTSHRFKRPRKRQTISDMVMECTLKYLCTSDQGGDDGFFFCRAGVST